MSNDVQAFAMIPVRVITDASLSHAEFRAFAAVVVHRHNKSGWSFPTHAVLAADLGLKPGIGGEDRVRQLLKPSIEKGYLERVAGAGRTRSRYRVRYDQPEPSEQELRDAGAIDDIPSEADGPMEDRRLPPLAAPVFTPLAATGCTILENYTREPNEPESVPLAPARAPKPAIRKTALKEDWQPSPEDRAFAETRGVDCDSEAEKFRYYHLGKHTLNVRWDLVWRTWVLNAVKYGNVKSAPERGSLFSAAAADPGDPFGATTWSYTLRDTVPDTNRGQPIRTLGGSDVVGVAIDCCEAAGIEPTHRPDLEPVARWLRDGIQPELIVQAIRTSKHPDRPNLRYFDARIRDMAGRKVA